MHFLFRFLLNMILGCNDIVCAVVVQANCKFFLGNFWGVPRVEIQNNTALRVLLQQPSWKSGGYSLILYTDGSHDKVVIYYFTYTNVFGTALSFRDIDTIRILKDRAPQSPNTNFVTRAILCISSLKVLLIPKNASYFKINQWFRIVFFSKTK